MSYKWPVVPLCKKQLMDVQNKDILFNGLYRYCDIYKGGGGYDKFGDIYKKRFGVSADQRQFVVQLKGCPLKCPYCYVTDEGINGSAVLVTTGKLLSDYTSSGSEVFHLMGGAPAIYLKHWKDLAYKVKIFHSDFLLIEKAYDMEDLVELPGLHAVSFKEKYLYKKEHLAIMWENLQKLIDANIDFYITFTGCDEFSDEIKRRFGSEILKDSFVIELIKYDALGEI